MARLKVDIREEFLSNGGILVKKGENSAGEPIILQKRKDADWHTRLTFSSHELRDKSFKYLTEKQSKFFKRG